MTKLKETKMHRTKILLIVAILFSATGFARAEENKLGVTLDYTYASKWMTKGKEGYGQQGGLFETIALDLWGTGFGTAVTHQQATASGYVNKERFNYDVYYSNSCFNDEAYETQYKIKWRYKHYPNLARNVKNSQEWEFSFSWPKILPVDNLFPYYVAYYEYPAGSNYDNRDITGWVHLFGMGYDLSIAELPNPLRLSADVGYRDGLGGESFDHDWSHATLGISTKFKIANNLFFAPSLYHQISMDDSVCNRDVTYCKLSVKYKF
jgi:hypothetical protein